MKSIIFFNYYPCAKVKMNQTEKAVKGLQRELKVEEGEHRSTGELVLEVGKE